MRFATILLAVLFGLLQYELWLGQGGIIERKALHEELVSLDGEHRSVRSDNQQLRQSLLSYEAEPNQLLSLIEARARNDLGFIREGETFYWVVEKE